jgi:hypothetical protein
MALVDRRDPRDCAGLVIKDFVGNMGRDAQPGHVRSLPPPSSIPRRAARTDVLGYGQAREG